MTKFLNKNALMAVATGALVFSACSHETDFYNPDFNPNKAEYEKNWKNTFGDINPEQDWNVAEQKTVTVSVNETSTICIFAENGDVNSLVAQFDNFSGSKKITFDAAETVKKVIVMKKSNTGYSAKSVNVGGTADFTGTRAIYSGTNGDVTVQETADFKEFTKEEVCRFYEMLPEYENSLGKVTQNFTFVSTGSFTIYPTYWSSSQVHTIGIYYMGEDGNMKEVDLFTNRDGEINQVDFHGYWEGLTYNFATSDGQGAIPWGMQRYRSKGVVVNIPAGTVFGMYTKCGDTQLYSEKEKNEYSYDGIEKAAHGATFKLDDVLYLGFEDWTGVGSDKDFNDIICQFYGAEPTIIDEDATLAEWILACEDLGSVDDFDFNDVVFKVSHVSGQPKAEVTVLDAGGTLPATIYCGDNKIGEAHSLLGVASNVMTTQTGANASEPIEIDVPADFSIANNMGGFKIYVTKDQTSVTSVNAPGKGEVPQIICVPATWKWPKERVNISDAYPLFGEWGSNWQNSTWYENCVDDKVISK